MRVKSTIPSFFILLVFFSCSTIKYKNMASSNPRKLISLRDSLDKELSPSLIDAFIEAYNKVGIQAYNSEDYEKSISMFLNSQELSSVDTLSKYYLLMASGKKKYQSGNKELLWESIQDFYEASELYPKIGEPFYLIGQSYLKLGDKDFDLIIESYDRALSLDVDEELKISINSSRTEAIRRKDLLKSFWK